MCEWSSTWKSAILILFLWLNILCYTLLWRHVYVTVWLCNQQWYHWLLSVIEYLNIKQLWSKYLSWKYETMLHFLCSYSYLFTFLLFSQFYWHIRWKSTAYFFYEPPYIFGPVIVDLLLVCKFLTALTNIAWKCEWWLNRKPLRECKLLPRLKQFLLPDGNLCASTMQLLYLQ